MPETRRELFTNTVMGALGAAATVGLVGGFVAGRETVSSRTAAAPVAGSVVALHNTIDNLWYFFHFETNSANCAVYSAPAVSITDASVDTTSWYDAVLKKRIKSTTKINYNTEGGSGSITLDFTADHYVLDSPTSLQKLLALVASDDTSYSQIPGSWNEIGKA